MPVTVSRQDLHRFGVTWQCGRTDGRTLKLISGCTVAEVTADANVAVISTVVEGVLQVHSFS
jgi:hypothetical protein